MPFDVIDADYRHPETKRHRPGEVHTHEKRSYQPGTVCYGDRVDVGTLDTRIGERLLNNRPDLYEMLARRYLRDHAAPLPVNIDLGIDDGRKYLPPVPDYGGGGFVARALDPQNQHGFKFKAGVRKAQAGLTGGCGLHNVRLNQVSGGQENIMDGNEFPALSGKEFLIMEMLGQNGQMFGLEMVDSSDGDLKKGTIYVTLGRMIDKGLVFQADPEEGDGARVMYSATDWGKRVFKAQEIALKYLNMGGW